MNELRNLAPDLWVLDQPFKMMGCEIGVRMTVVRTDGGLLLHSPVKPTPQWVSAVRELGEVRWIVAPSLMHNLFAPAAKVSFPEAGVYAPKGFEGVQPTLPTHDLKAGTWTDLEVFAIDGMPKVRESVLLHTPSRTLIVTDLLFNVPPTAPWLTRMFFALNGGVGRVVQTRIFKRYIQDRAAHEASIRALLERDFDRIILSHGTPVETGGKEILQDVYRTG